MTDHVTALCSTHERAHRDRVRRAARARIASSTCPICVVARDIESAQEGARIANLDAGRYIEERDRARAQSERDAAEAQRMNDIVSDLRACARGALARGRDHYEPTLRTIAGEGRS